MARKKNKKSTKVPYDLIRSQAVVTDYVSSTNTFELVSLLDLNTLVANWKSNRTLPIFSKLNVRIDAYKQGGNSLVIDYLILMMKNGETITESETTGDNVNLALNTILTGKVFSAEFKRTMNAPIRFWGLTPSDDTVQMRRYGTTTVNITEVCNKLAQMIESPKADSDVPHVYLAALINVYSADTELIEQVITTQGEVRYAPVTNQLSL